MEFAVKVVIAALVISFASWLAGRFPTIAGFVIAMPIATMIVMPFAQIEYQDPARTAALAKGILIAIPVSVMFLVPFLLIDRLGGFWPAYGLGFLLLVAGFFLQQWVVRFL